MKSDAYKRRCAKVHFVGFFVFLRFPFVFFLRVIQKVSACLLPAASRRRQLQITSAVIIRVGLRGNGKGLGL